MIAARESEKLEKRIVRGALFGCLSKQRQKLLKKQPLLSHKYLNIKTSRCMRKMKSLTMGAVLIFVCGSHL